jgi:hypothetical protein
MPARIRRRESTVVSPGTAVSSAAAYDSSSSAVVPMTAASLEGK